MNIGDILRKYKNVISGIVKDSMMLKLTLKENNVKN